MLHSNENSQIFLQEIKINLTDLLVSLRYVYVDLTSLHCFQYLLRMHV